MKGIILKPNVIKAIAEGRKTQTRRVIKPQPLSGRGIRHYKDSQFVVNSTSDPLPALYTIKPRYQVGEVVYIKEKLLVWDGGAGGLSNFVYTDDPEISALLEDNNRLLVARETDNILAGEPVVGKWQWRSPLFMFAEQARYFIKITAIRIGRLKDITWEEAEQEGFNRQEWEANYWVFVYSFKRVEAEK